MEERTFDLSIPLSSGHSLFARHVRAERNEQPSTLPPLVLLVLHGGPGVASHDESFAGLKALLRAPHNPDNLISDMLFYDQLGCGKSNNTSTPKEAAALVTKLNDKSSLLSYYCDELDQVIAFAQKRFPEARLGLFGHSWGGQLALEWLLTRSSSSATTTVTCAIVSNAPLDERHYEQKQKDMRAKLDPEIQSYYEGEEAQLAQDNPVGYSILARLVGPSEVQITGELQSWSVLERAKHLMTPCLFVCGTDDTVPEEDYRYIQSTLPLHSQVEVLEGGTWSVLRPLGTCLFAAPFRVSDYHV